MYLEDIWASIKRFVIPILVIPLCLAIAYFVLSPRVEPEGTYAASMTLYVNSAASAEGSIESPMDEAWIAYSEDDNAAAIANLIDQSLMKTTVIESLDLNPTDFTITTNQAKNTIVITCEGDNEDEVVSVLKALGESATAEADEYLGNSLLIPGSVTASLPLVTENMNEPQDHGLRNSVLVFVGGAILLSIVFVLYDAFAPSIRTGQSAANAIELPLLDTLSSDCDDFSNCAYTLAATLRGPDGERLASVALVDASLDNAGSQIANELARACSNEGRTVSVISLGDDSTAQTERMPNGSNNVSAYASSVEFERRLADSKAVHDLTIVIVPASSSDSNLAPVALVDVVAFCVSLGHSSREYLIKARTKVTMLHGNAVGVIALA